MEPDDDDGYRVDARRYSLDTCNLDEVHSHVQEVKYMLEGRHPSFLLDPVFRDENGDLRRRVHALLDWVLRFYGSKAFLDGAELTQRSESLERHVLKLYGRHQEFIELESHDVQGREREYTDKMEWCLRVRSSLGSIVKAMQDLHCLFLYPADSRPSEISYIYHRLNVAKAIEVAQARHDAGAAPRKENREYYVMDALHIMYQEALRRGYRHIGPCIYQEQTTEFEGTVYGTRTYRLASFDGKPSVKKEDCLVKTFMSYVLNMKRYPLLHQKVWVMGHHEVRHALENSTESEFPILKCDRDQITYRNGVFFTQSLDHMGLFEPWDVFKSREPKPGKYGISAKFVDDVYRDSWRFAADWFNIPTPNFQSILDYQNTGMKKVAAQAAARPYAELSADLWRGEVEATERARLLHGELETATGASARDKLRAIARLHDDCALRLREKLATLEGLQEEGWRAPAEAPSDASSASGFPPTRRVPEQRFPEEVQRWVYVFLGRLLHELRAFDNWQVIPFFKGLAGTGKSVIAAVAHNFFEPQYVGFLSSNCEEKFGIYPLLNTFLYICPEVKKDFALKESDFLNMVSGDPMSIPIKNESALPIIWNIPGLFCGNEFPANYTGKGGSVLRRIVVSHFSFPVCAQDTKPRLLEDILQTELGALIVKCNSAYRQQARLYGFKESIWNVLPQYFKDQSVALQLETNALKAALWDRSLFEPQVDAIVDFNDTFMNEYKRKWKQIKGNKEVPAQVTEDDFNVARGDLLVSLVTEERPDPHTKIPRVAKWLVGLRYLLGSDAAGSGSTGGSWRAY